MGRCRDHDPSQVETSGSTLQSPSDSESISDQRVERQPDLSCALEPFVSLSLTLAPLLPNALIRMEHLDDFAHLERLQRIDG